MPPERAGRGAKTIAVLAVCTALVFALQVALAAIPAAVAGGVLLALVQRVREIGRRELDEARQF